MITAQRSTCSRCLCRSLATSYDACLQLVEFTPRYFRILVTIRNNISLSPCFLVVFPWCTGYHQEPRVALMSHQSPHRTVTQLRRSLHCGVEFLSRELCYFISFPFVFLAVLHRPKLLATVGTLSDFAYSGTRLTKSRQKRIMGNLCLDFRTACIKPHLSSNAIFPGFLKYPRISP